MNRSIWILLGILSILAGLSLILAVPDRLAVLPPDQHAKLIQGAIFMSGLCGIIAIACFFPQSHRVTLRILGTYGVAACLFSLFEGTRQRDFSLFPMILVFWLPGSIYLMVKGKMTAP